MPLAPWQGGAVSPFSDYENRAALTDTRCAAMLRYGTTDGLYPDIARFNGVACDKR